MSAVAWWALAITVAAAVVIAGAAVVLIRDERDRVSLAEQEAARAALLYQREITQLRAERDAFRAQLDKALGQAAEDITARADDKDAAIRAALGTIRHAAWAPGDPHRPQTASVPSLIAAISDTSLALEAYRREEYIRDHPEYVQGWSPTEAAQ